MFCRCLKKLGAKARNLHQLCIFFLGGAEKHMFFFKCAFEGQEKIRKTMPFFGGKKITQKYPHIFRTQKNYAFFWWCQKNYAFLEAGPGKQKYQFYTVKCIFLAYFYQKLNVVLRIMQKICIVHCKMDIFASQGLPPKMHNFLASQKMHYLFVS